MKSIEKFEKKFKKGVVEFKTQSDIMFVSGKKVSKSTQYETAADKTS